ncbi:hypothetical protein BDV96DRAFT_605342 [Lophiotrema nucula]|uniref:Uncharacterized protein n=1 Tax=Lophiotrema nucula TaxID=690887 RepID=A0A6A5YQD4_9PLEO|nr:hypothetical protein BDV96DRAFT_605342 [Lophiotrema nucula]
MMFSRNTILLLIGLLVASPIAALPNAHLEPDMALRDAEPAAQPDASDTLAILEGREDAAYCATTSKAGKSCQISACPSSECKMSDKKSIRGMVLHGSHEGQDSGGKSFRRKLLRRSFQKGFGM